MKLMFRPQKPCAFRHQPIYWDPKEKQLQRRIEQIRRELETAEDSGTAGSNDDTSKEDGKRVGSVYGLDEEFRDTFSKSLYGGARHLRRQRDRGIDSYAHSGIILRCILMLIFLDFAIWVLYYRQGPLFFFL